MEAKLKVNTLWAYFFFPVIGLGGQNLHFANYGDCIYCLNCNISILYKKLLAVQ